MSKIRRFVILSITLVASLATGMAYAAGWETMKTEIRDAKSVIKEADIEILTTPGCIMISSSRQSSIQVFTILGRLVSSETLPPGTFRLMVGAHGVYIVKVGELTCKVAI